MKCPLLMIPITEKGRIDRGTSDECRKETCVWWDKVEKGCLITFIEKDLAGIWTMLSVIANQMPHAG